MDKNGVIYRGDIRLYYPRVLFTGRETTEILHGKNVTKCSDCSDYKFIVKGTFQCGLGLHIIN